jgi:hypothetical protein
VARINRTAKSASFLLQLHPGLVNSLLDLGVDYDTPEEIELDDLLVDRTIPAKLIPSLLERAGYLIENEESSEIKELAELLHTLCCRTYGLTTADDVMRSVRSRKPRRARLANPRSAKN